MEALNLQFRQIAILRFGALGAVFQFIFIASTSILLFFNTQHFVASRLLFFVLNMVLTAITLAISEDYYEGSAIFSPA